MLSGGLIDLVEFDLIPSALFELFVETASAFAPLLVASAVFVSVSVLVDLFI